MDPSVWVANEAGTFICNTNELSAQRLAETHKTHIYFFAELVDPLAV
jgi:hypothetical protein